MDDFLYKLKNIDNIDDALIYFNDNVASTLLIQKALKFCIDAHTNQYRKSGEPYVVHPILVATLTSYFFNNETMILSALLHDIVEDTKYTLSYIKQEYGSDVSYIVDGLTKITVIKDTNVINKDDKLIKSAHTFKKLLTASITDTRVLIIKIFDRVHNMLTLDPLSQEKQKRISEETLVVYAPIAHKLGMNKIKNILEDLAFYYLYPNEYNKIDKFIEDNKSLIYTKFDNFVLKIDQLINENNNNIQISSRRKHHYSIYLKMQRKGITIGEVLDICAIRIITDTKLDCYNILGKIHINYRPLISRFKDYIAVAKENGYQTIHTTVFYDTQIFEIQIRTKQMHQVAEFGLASHWKYKEKENTKPILNWINTIENDNDNVEEFYKDTKENLLCDDIIVYSPRGDIFTLPRGSTVYDYAYLIHSDIGNMAQDCYINNVKKPLLELLKNGDLVSINLSNHIIYRCSWMKFVKTAKAKKNIKLSCLHRIKEIEKHTSKNIINTIFYKYKQNILDNTTIEKMDTICNNLDSLRNVKFQLQNMIKDNDGFLARFKIYNTTLKKYIFDNIILYSNHKISKISFDHCCHPKLGDEIVAFKNKNSVIIHHKMCDKGYDLIFNNNKMVYCQWNDNKYFGYSMVLSIQNKKGELAKLLNHLSNKEAIILSIDFRRDERSHIQYCTIDLEIKDSDIENVRKIVSKMASIIELNSIKDAYK